jgi:SAM-dependent methyltransferase
MSLIYQHFAKFYAQGPYMAYSQRMLEFLPVLAEKFNLPTIGACLDLACGEGSFLRGMAALGWDATGVDQSEEMLSIASQRSSEAGLNIRWQAGDFRKLDFTAEFDLVTCWFDSLNYMTSPDDLQAVFQGAAAALKPGGVFIFDMNTIYGLLVAWQQNSTYVQVDTPEYMEIHQNSCDYDQQTALLRITMFEQDTDGRWQRYEESHLERGYPLLTLQSLLTRCGLTVLACTDSLSAFTEPNEKTRRVYFICQKRGA